MIGSIFWKFYHIYRQSSSWLMFKVKVRLGKPVMENLGRCTCRSTETWHSGMHSTQCCLAVINTQNWPCRQRASSASYRSMRPRSRAHLSRSLSYRRFHSSAVSSSFTITVFLIVFALTTTQAGSVSHCWVGRPWHKCKEVHLLAAMSHYHAA